MQFKAVLGNAKHPEYGVANIPFPIPMEQYESTIEMMRALEIGDALERDCRVEEITHEKCRKADHRPYRLRKR